MTELTENRDIAPFFVEADPADAVLADSDISEGVVPSMNELPHAELKSLVTCVGIAPGKSLFTML
jgi:hypothetical protein